MRSLPHPGGAARSIFDAWSSALHPDELVIVVLAGYFDWPNQMVYATPGRRYRWDWLSGMNVVILIDANTKLDGILSDIDGAGPKQLDVLDHERRLGWMVLRCRPRIETVRWPQHQVDDWLGDQEWHIALNDLKAKYKTDTVGRQPPEQGGV